MLSAVTVGRRPFACSTVAKRVPVQLLHHEVREAELVRRHSGGDDLDDVRMREPGEDARLLVDARGELLPIAELGVERLEDVVLPDARVLDLVDGPHPPLSEELDDPVDGPRDDLVRLVVAHPDFCAGVGTTWRPTFSPTA